MTEPAYMPLWREMIREVEKPEYRELIRHAIHLEEENARLREVLEKIQHWKADARVCCFPVDIGEVLKQ